MSLESFYGGKQGISPVIKASFEYIDTNDNAYQAALAGGAAAPNLLSKTMDLCFADANYENVWYNELCIIDTSNKNNPNNGKLFRRTLKGNGDTGINLCAEYIGRIVGPAGTSPFFSFGNLNSVNAQGTTEKINVDPSMQISYPIDTNGNISSNKINEQGIQFNIEPTIQTASIDNNMLVSGKTNDNIRYTWLNVVDDTTDIPTRSIIYMGFEIPYPVLELNSTFTEWWNDISITKRTTGEYSTRPFYHVWDLTIPRGVRGNAATNIRLTQQKEFSNIKGGVSGKPVLYNFSDFEDDGTGVYNLRTLTDANDKYGPTDLPNAPNSYIWVYDYIFYDISYDNPSTATQEISKTYSFYLGKYNEISNVVLEDDGTLIFEYSNTEENIFNKKIPWINNIDITSDGLLSFEWNQENYRVTGDLTPQNDKTYYIRSGNNYTAQSGLTQFVPDITYYEFTDTYSKQLPYPTDVNIDANGRIIIGLSGRDSFIVQDPNIQDDYHLNYVNSLSMDSDTKVLSYTTSVASSGTTSLNNNKGLNYIEAITIDDNYHLLVYYASSQYRITQSDLSAGRKDNKTITTNGDYAYWDNKVFRTGISGYDNIYWQDFGVVKDTAAVKISTEVDYSRLSNSSTIDNYGVEQFLTNILNTQTWSDGGSNPYYGGNIPGTLPSGSNWTLRGTLVFASKINNGSFFFYDYADNRWKHAGSLAEATQIDAQILLNNNTALNNKTFTEDGVRFIEKSTAARSDLLPAF